MKDRPIRKLTLALLLLTLPLMASSLELVEREHPWEIGFGMVGGWKQLEEASAADPFHLNDQAGFGFALTGARWLGSRVKLTFDVESSLHDTNLADVQANFVTFTFGIRGHFLDRGPIRPYLRGSFGGAKTSIESVNGSGERLELSGMGAVMGGGLHLAPSKRIRFDLEINHTVIEYGDASVILDSVYVGTRINKAASATRIRFSTLFLL
jgi:hypothetical protein